MEGKKRAAIYVRVSTAEQRDHGLSVDSQIDALQKYCRENGLEVAGIYNDAGISARKKYKARPALLQLIQDCKDHKIDIILGELSGRTTRRKRPQVFSRLTSCFPSPKLSQTAPQSVSERLTSIANRRDIS